MRRATINLPLPPKTLHANARSHWRSKAKATATHRSMAKLAALATGVRITGQCRVDYRFFFSTNRRRDAANWVAACKAAIDGAVDAKLIEGDHWQVLSIGSVTIEVDKLRPRVELVFEQVDPPDWCSQHECAIKMTTGR